MTPSIHDAYQRFKHLDAVLLGCAECDDPIYQTAAALWTAIKSEAEISINNPVTGARYPVAPPRDGVGAGRPGLWRRSP